MILVLNEDKNTKRDNQKVRYCKENDRERKEATFKYLCSFFFLPFTFSLLTFLAIQCLISIPLFCNLAKPIIHEAASFGLRNEWTYEDSKLLISVLPSRTDNIFFRLLLSFEIIIIIISRDREREREMMSWGNSKSFDMISNGRIYL